MNNQIATFQESLQATRHLESKDFGVFGITHKFDSKLNQANQFSTCHAVFMTCVVMPPRDDNERFRLGVCCDRRGDSALEFEGPLQNADDIAKTWSSKEHWKIYDDINLKQCPRCTYQPHNQIYEHVIQEDKPQLSWDS